MQGGNAVDLVAGHHCQPRHAHPAAVGFIDDRDPRQQVVVARRHFLHHLEEVIVDFENQLQMARQDAPYHVQRPGFQRLAHLRVVGVGKHLLHHFPGVEPLEFVLVDQPVHQFGNRQHRVSVVEVNGDLVRQVVEGFMHQPMAVEDVLHRGRHQEILLPQPQLAPGGGRVVRIQHARHVLRVVLSSTAAK